MTWNCLFLHGLARTSLHISNIILSPVFLFFAISSSVNFLKATPLLLVAFVLLPAEDVLLPEVLPVLVGAVLFSVPPLDSAFFVVITLLVRLDPLYLGSWVHTSLDLFQLDDTGVFRCLIRKSSLFFLANFSLLPPSCQAYNLL